MSETFLYEVVPHRPIRGLVSGKAITRPMVLLLDKEDVIECLRKATVYRRFSSNKREKVTAYTVNRFHRKEFISEESFKRLQEYEAKKEISEQTFEPAIAVQAEDAVKQEELKDEVNESVPEETVEEPVTEEVAESETTEEEIEEEMAEEVSEEIEKKENEEPSGSDDSLEETQNSEFQQQKPRARAKARTKNRR